MQIDKERLKIHVSQDHFKPSDDAIEELGATLVQSHEQLMYDYPKFVDEAVNEKCRAKHESDCRAVVEDLLHDLIEFLNNSVEED